jgi:hypothetical protein
MIARSGLKKFYALPRQERWLFIEALTLQLRVGLLLKLIPFKWIPRLFANKVQGTRSPEPGTLNPEPGTRNLKPAGRRVQPEIIEQIKTAIQRSAPLSPWRNRCLVQSLAARRMLGRRKIQSQLSLGVAINEDKKMIAHAWLKASDIEIVERRGDYHEMYLF